MQSAGAIRYTHDAAGRTTVRRKTRLSRRPDTWHYTYDAEDRLTSCTTPDGTLWTYTYDPLGRRTAKLRWSDDRQTVVEHTTFTWDGTRLAEQTDTATGVTLTWDHEGHRPLTQLERKPSTLTPSEVDSRFFAIVTDLVGTPTELVDETGHIAWHTRTTLW
ncbi:RHS domain-containing protein, partial [Streptomyces durbertensis]|nr:RHS domain-containing protein [Streptomyces durbertensis]